MHGSPYGSHAYLSAYRLGSHSHNYAICASICRAHTSDLRVAAGGLSSRAVPHADKVGRLARVRVARVRHASGRRVEGEDGAGVGVLVGHEEPLARSVELEVAGRFAARVKDAGESEHAGWG